ncbi:glucose-6-phosphate isomerase [Rickettsiales bacterium LUAb2]
MINYSLIQELCTEIKQKNLAELFTDNPNRFNENSLSLNDLLFDYSKNYLTKQILNEFIKQAEVIGLNNYIQQMFSGEKINFTENRAVLHVALRNNKIKPVVVDGVDYYSQIWQTLENMTNFAEKVRNGIINGSTNKRYTDIVNIGIGGSSLPLQMAYQALLPFKQNDINVHFISNVDYANVYEVLKPLNPETTLIIVASKTFTTEETMLNAKSAKEWLVKSLGEAAVKSHFVALSTNLIEVTKFGITEENTFGFWDFVGGRYSLWSSIGLSLAIAIGKDNFLELLNGAQIVDEHFKNTSLEKNIPFIMAVISSMYRNCFDYRAEAILPYSYYLQKFPSYLQQVNMESNGKSVDKQNNLLTTKTGAILFGESGTDSQHSFYQLLHQGSDITPIDFIGFISQTTNPNVTIHEQTQAQIHNDILIANMIAQAEAFMIGKNKAVVIEELKEKGIKEVEIQNLASHKVFQGNRPSNILLFKQLNPKTLGMLCSLYEHKIFIQGVFWGINSFDQFGVELGKELAKVIIKDINNSETKKHDSSTTSLIQYYKSKK